MMKELNKELNIQDFIVEDRLSFKNIFEQAEKDVELLRKDMDFHISWLDSAYLLFSKGSELGYQMLSEIINGELEDLNKTVKITQNPNGFYSSSIYVEKYGEILEVDFFDKKAFFKMNYLKKDYWDKMIESFRIKIDDKESEIKKLSSKSGFVLNFNKEKKEFNQYQIDLASNDISKYKEEIRELEYKKENLMDNVLIFERLFRVFQDSNYKLFDVDGVIELEDIDEIFKSY